MPHGNMRRTVIATVTLAAVLATLAISPTARGDWTFETLDGHQNGPNGQTADDVGWDSATLLYQGQPHVWYHDDTAGDLRHAWWNGWTWTFETLDGHQNGPNGQTTNSVGNHNAVILYGGRPHVWYRDNGTGDLRHAWWTGATWHFETLDGHQNGPTGQTTGNVAWHNTVTVYGGHPHVWYRDDTAGDLRHAWWTGATWWFETLDGHRNGPRGETTHDVGWSAAATIFGGNPHVWYLDYTGEDLRHAWWTGTAWYFETLDGQGGPNGQTTDRVGTENAVTLYGGNPHVWYWNAHAGDLRHAWWNGSTWWFETLDGHQTGPNGQTTNTVGTNNAVTLYDGQPHVWYHDHTLGLLRHAWWTGTAWYFEVLDGQGGANGETMTSVGTHNATTLYGGQPHVWYRDLTFSDLRHTWWTP